MKLTGAQVRRYEGGVRECTKALMQMIMAQIDINFMLVK